MKIVELSKLSKAKRKELDKFIEENGACGFDFKTDNIILYDGGLFCIEKKTVKVRKIVGYKPVTEGPCKGGKEIIFSKKRCVNSEQYNAFLWPGELDSTINYLQRLKRLLNKLGVTTNASP